MMNHRDVKDVLLIVYGPNFVAGAMMHKSDDWQWGDVAPIIRWFKSRTVEDIGKWLKNHACRQGWSYILRPV